MWFGGRLYGHELVRSPIGASLERAKSRHYFSFLCVLYRSDFSEHVGPPRHSVYRASTCEFLAVDGSRFSGRSRLRRGDRRQDSFDGHRPLEIAMVGTAEELRGDESHCDQRCYIEKVR